MAGYLYFLADMSAQEAVELARWQTEASLAELAGLGRRPCRGQVELARARHAEDLRRLRRWLSGAGRADAQEALDGLQRRLSRAAGAIRCRTAAADRHGDRRVPRRTAAILPTPENLFPEACARLGAAPGPAWVHYLADGRRNIGQIAELTRAQTGRDWPTAALARRFEVLAELGYLRLAGPRG
jgi:hypothetical protein